MDHEQDLKGQVVAIIGGDRRQVEIMRMFGRRGARLISYGTPSVSREEAESLGISKPMEAANLRKALSAADIVVLPVPTYLRDHVLYAPYSSEEIPFSANEAAMLERGATLAISKLLSDVKETLRQRDVSVCVLVDDDVMQVHHAIPTAEGALKITIENTEFTVFGSKALVIGFGRVAQSMARALKGLGATVTVAARREEARVRAHAEGFAPLDMNELEDRLGEFDLIYNTVPAAVLTESELSRAAGHALVVDLASPPGGVDHEAAKRLGVKAIWARGQASSAPKYAGWAQYKVIERFIQDHSAKQDRSEESDREPVQH